MAWNRQRTWKTLALWLGLAALMVQAVAPLCAAGRVGTGAAGSSNIVLCTAHGLETIRIGADGRPVQDAPAQDQQASCLLCAFCHTATGFTAPASIGVAAPLIFAQKRGIIAAAPAIASRAYLSYVTRGPPALTLTRPV